jgi:hypothetical protein
MEVLFFSFFSFSDRKPDFGLIIVLLTKTNLARDTLFNYVTISFRALGKTFKFTQKESNTFKG